MDHCSRPHWRWNRLQFWHRWRQSCLLSWRQSQRNAPRISIISVRNAVESWSQRVLWKFTFACTPIHVHSLVQPVVVDSEQTAAWRGIRYCWWKHCSQIVFTCFFHAASLEICFDMYPGNWHLRYDMMYLRALKSWQYGQLSLVHGTETKIKEN